MIDFLLKSEASSPIVLEISDGFGKLVRRFSSADKPEVVEPNHLNIPTYWIRPQQTLQGQRGLHRFVWDLRYPSPDSLRREYPISAIFHDTPRYPLGPAVLPGGYTVRLTVGDQSYTQTLTIKMDPRAKSSMQDLREQFELESSICAAMHADFQVLRQVRGLRQQSQALKNRGIAAPVAEDLARLEDKLRDLEGVEEGATFLSTPQGRSLARLNIGLTSLLELVDSADTRPTTQQSAMFRELKSALEQQLANWAGIKKTDVPALNLKLNQSGLQTLDAEFAVIIDKSWHSVEKAAGGD
jgi:hypothetical protein